jgi:phospholipid/cholesterol/gamma-HCH transport system substrate-binding protein
MKLDADNKARIAFALVLLLGAAGGIVWYLFSSSRYTTYQIQTHDPVSGLIADAPVEYHGVDVGRVKSVELIDSRSVRILLSIKNGAPVTAATVATITSRGLATRGFTGYVYVSLEDAGTDSRSLVARPDERYPAIPTAPSKSVNLDLAISQVNQNVQFMTELLQNVLDKNTVASLKQSVDSLQQVTKMLADNNAKMNSLIINGERASRQLQPLLASSQDAVNTLQTQVLPETHRALTSLDNLSTSLQPLLESSKDTVNALQTQVLPEAHKALTSLDYLSKSLSGFATKVSKDPSVIVRGVAPPLPGPGEEE